MQKNSSLSPQKVQKISLAAIKHYSKNRLKDGRKQVSTLLSSDWQDSNTFFQAGIAAFNAGDVETSVLLYKKATDLTPKAEKQHSNLFMGLGSAYSALMKDEDAIRSFDKAVALDPENANAFNSRALVYYKRGDSATATLDLKKAHSLAPDNIGIILNLGDLLSKSDPEEALSFYQNKLFIHTQVAEIYLAAANLLEVNKPEEAFQYYRNAALLKPQNGKYLQAYARVFPLLPKVANIDVMGNDLLLLLSSEMVQWNNLNRVVRQYVKTRPPFKEILPSVTRSVQTNSDLQLEYGKVIKALSDTVLLAAMKKMRFVDPEIEKTLELFRRQTLAVIVSGQKIEKPLFDLLTAFLAPLAHYCFFTEFLFVENEFEKKTVQALIEYFEAGATGSSEETILRFLILSCYRQCHKLTFAGRVSENKTLIAHPEIAQLIKTQIIEPKIEYASHKSIKQLTTIEDGISLSVREQYEENPYPRWQHLPPTSPTTYAAHVTGKLPILEGKKPEFPKNPQVLIAGCGTGRQPISTAKAFPETNVLAVDLSLASISYAMRKAKELKIRNIEFGQADIMELGTLGQKFHIIECAGVLHHMHDPVAGWRVLCDLLEDDGYMIIGLYSELGRKDVVASRQFIQDNEYSGQAEDIRSCRKELMALENSHPAKRITNHNDFYTISACRDLIFHVQEHRFTVPKIQVALDDLGLEFLGFNMDRKTYLTEYKKMFPDDIYQTNLENWDLFETQNPDVFSAMYKFWVRKKRN